MIEIITDAFAEVWDVVSGFFSGGDVNPAGVIILTLCAEAILWGFWWYCTYKVGATAPAAKHFLSWTTMIIGTVAAPVVSYFFAWRVGRQ